MGDDTSLLQILQVEIADVSAAPSHRKLKHLIEIAVIESTLPIDAERVPAHL